MTLISIALCGDNFAILIKGITKETLTNIVEHIFKVWNASKFISITSQSATLAPELVSGSDYKVDPVSVHGQQGKWVIRMLNNVKVFGITHSSQKICSLRYCLPYNFQAVL